MVTDRLTASDVEQAGALHERLTHDRASEAVFGKLARLAAHAFSAPLVFIEFARGDEQGIEFRSGRELVASDFLIASAPLYASDGSLLGSISVRDERPRSFDRIQESLLVEFAALVVHNYEARLEALREREIERYRLEVLKLAANDAPLERIFANLVECVEYCIPGSICTIALLRDGRLYTASSGMAMPDAFLEEIEALAVGPKVGSCGAAAYRRSTMVSAEIASDPLWHDFRAAASRAGLASCWSTPICTADNAVLGTLAIYRRYAAEPSAQNLEFTHEAAHVAAIAIEANNARLRLEQMALHDPLTALPNRALFEDRMQQAIASSQRTGRRVAIGLMDLNRFKVINDSLGHAVGDRLLIDVAKRLRNAVRPQDTVARMGGDEFLLLMADLDERESARGIAERFISMLEPSFSPYGNEIFVRGSMGVSVYPDDSRDSSQLLRYADGAMYAAKASGDAIAFYRGVSPAPALSRLEIEASLHGVLEKRELELYYEPQVSLADGTIRAAEAQLRWRHPRLGLLEPDVFIPIAEDIGLSAAIGTWALYAATRFARRWQDAGGAGTVWVNVYPRQFGAAAFASSVKGALEASGLPASKLWLEVSEPLIMRSPEQVASVLSKLRVLGVHSAIDDFGIGYSSLSSLKTLPVGAVKIGRAFARGVGFKGGSADEAIVNAILGVGRALGLRVVGQGIETSAQLAYLRESGCPLGQGPYFSPALDADALLAWTPAEGFGR